MPTHSLLHTANVVIHVSFGTLALMAGAIALAVAKGGRRHRQAGRFFTMTLEAVIATAVFGVLLFQFRAFLGLLTVLAAYNAYSGLRALALRETAPARRDTLAALGVLLLAVIFTRFARSAPLTFAPVVVYSTVAALVISAGYDLLRLTFPVTWRPTLWLYEHLVKMLAAYSAVVQAFAGTVLVQWQPYSQMLPGLLLTFAMVAYGMQLRRRQRRARQLAAARVTLAHG